jgi:hypothetical protein
MDRQFLSGRWLIAILLVSIALWAVMVFGKLAHLRRLAGGLDPFDVRPFGDSAGEARLLLDALGEAGREFYARVQLRLDAVYPASYAVSRGLLLWWLTRGADCVAAACAAFVFAGRGCRVRLCREYPNRAHVGGERERRNWRDRDREPDDAAQVTRFQRDRELRDRARHHCRVALAAPASIVSALCIRRFCFVRSGNDTLQSSRLRCWVSGRLYDEHA